ncbi:MAG: FHA domain-containing protein [Deltaproteobacteria bacterium]|nr:FHA domain-containing protein [Deltaproteobacteria bacterium]
MTGKPTIVVQLVHIEGPLKGTIQEFLDSEITIGRNPSCHVRFPKDLAIISRNHARIVREGNRFKLIDASTNGTLVNGKWINEAFLKPGDVLIFAEGGPKVSFLTKIMDSPEPTSHIERIQAPISPDIKAARDIQPEQHFPKPDAGTPASVQTVHVPLVIQFGPTLQSFRELPVTVGKNAVCDFTVHHPEIMDRHAQFFYDRDQYWVKDLTGRNLVSINGHLVGTQAPLIPDCLLSLSPVGPTFRFLGGGRLAEHEAPTPE